MIKEQSLKLNMKPSSNKSLFRKNLNIKKPTKDYGKLTVEALKRQKD